MCVRRGWHDDSRGEPRGCIDIREWRMPFGWIRAYACTILRDLRRNRRRLPRVVVSNSVRRGCCRAQPNVRGIPRNDTCRATSYVQPRGFYCPLPVSDLLLCIDQEARSAVWGGRHRRPEAPNVGHTGSSSAGDDFSSRRKPWESELFLRRFIASRGPCSTCVGHASSGRTISALARVALHGWDYGHRGGSAFLPLDAPMAAA